MEGSVSILFSSAVSASLLVETLTLKAAILRLVRLCDVYFNFPLSFYLWRWEGNTAAFEGPRGLTAL